MYAKSLKDLKLEEHNKIGYTLKALGAGFWALQQSDFRKALTELVMEVRQLNCAKKRSTWWYVHRIYAIDAVLQMCFLKP